jgi:hypothetical protein
MGGFVAPVMKTCIRDSLMMAGAIAVAVVLATPAHAARRSSGPPVIVKKATKALVASP